MDTAYMGINGYYTLYYYPVFDSCTYKNPSKILINSAQWHQLKDLNIQKVDAFLSFIE